MLHQDKVVLVNSQLAKENDTGEPGTSHILAFDKADGKVAWKTELAATSTCYAVPCVLKMNGKPDQLIGANRGNGFYSIDPESGAMNWNEKLIRMRTVASPIVAGGLLFASSGSGGGGNTLVAMKPNEKSGGEKVYEHASAANYVPTPIAVGKYLFSFGDKGVLT